MDINIENKNDKQHISVLNDESDLQDNDEEKNTIIRSSLPAVRQICCKHMSGKYTVVAAIIEK